MKPNPQRAKVILVLLAAALCLTACQVKVGPGDVAWNEFAAPYRHDVDVGGYRMHYVDAGEGPPIVLIHGFADSSFTFSKNVPLLVKSGYRTIVVDQPGLGRSEVPPKSFVYSIENMAEAVLRCCDALGLEKFAVAGSSMGGGISLYLAIHHPERVAALVLFDPACYRLDRHGWMPFVATPGMTESFAGLAGRGVGAYALRDVFYDDAQVTDAMVDEYARPLNKPGYRHVIASLITQYFSPAFDAMAERYGQIDKPTLIVWGAQDTWVPPAFASRLHEQIPGSELLMVDQCGHLVQMECPDVVNPALLTFLRQHYR